VENLLANTIGSFAQMYGEEHRYGTLIRREIRKTELAEILGVARKSVIRAYRKLIDDKLIQQQGGYLVIPDLEALKAKAREF
jgi:CRP-like cAMP-binding protein